MQVFGGGCGVLVEGWFGGYDVWKELATWDLYIRMLELSLVYIFVNVIYLFPLCSSYAEDVVEVVDFL